MSNLDSFALLMKQAAEDKRVREETERTRLKSQVVPLLSELFDTINNSKKKKDEPVSLITESVNVIQASGKPIDSDIENKSLKLFNKLQNDFQTFKKYVENKPTYTGGAYGGTSGSGEVRILRMDDIDTSALSNGRMIIWDTILKKFKFVDVPLATNLGRPTTLVTSDYTVTSNDHYIGINSSTPITITLPSTFTDGTEFIFKDESGHASLIPITISGNIDNDPSGVIIQINNGSITVIYRNGWRII